MKSRELQGEKEILDDIYSIMSNVPRSNEVGSIQLPFNSGYGAEIVHSSVGETDQLSLYIYKSPGLFEKFRHRRNSKYKMKLDGRLYFLKFNNREFDSESSYTVPGKYESSFQNLSSRNFVPIRGDRREYGKLSKKNKRGFVDTVYSFMLYYNELA